MSGAQGSRLTRVVRHPSLSWARSLARHGLDALALRIAGRLPPPPEPPRFAAEPSRMADRPAIDPGQQAVELGRQMVGQQAMLSYHSLNRLDRSLLLQGRIAALQIATRDKISHLGDIEFRVCSQWGEDGIIEWLCQKIPSIPRSFVEFGVENFAEANARFLLENRGWRGLVMDGSADYMNSLRQDALYWRHDLTAAATFITVENINQVITGNGFAGELGILSVDIDGNDYWVLEAIDCVDPVIIICEINGVFGDLKPFTIPYRPDFQRMDAHYSGQYFGCSLAAAKLVCERKGYTFIGTNTNGVNAFFIRNDSAGPVVGSLKEIRAWAPRHRDSRNTRGELDFVRGLGRYDLVADMPVVDLMTGRLVALYELLPLYSDAFMEDFR
jgi:hypothetical protein